MSVFRIEKTRDYTVMSNHHLKNKALSLKAKGLMSLMLSLPEEWDFSMDGLSRISLEGVDAIRTGLSELEAEGYLETRRIRNEKGHFTDNEYIIYEVPLKEVSHADTTSEARTKKSKSQKKKATPTQVEPILENPMLDKPIEEEPVLENPMQLNTNISNTKELNTEDIKYPSINQSKAEPVESASSSSAKDRWIDIYNKTVADIKDQIEYDYLICNNNQKLVDEVVEIMADVMTVYRAKYKIEGEYIDCETVIHKFRKVTAEQIEVFLLEFEKQYSTIHNTKSYVITSLYNMPLTSNLKLTNMVNSHMHKGGTYEQQ